MAPTRRLHVNQHKRIDTFVLMNASCHSTSEQFCHYHFHVRLVKTAVCMLTLSIVYLFHPLPPSFLLQSFSLDWIQIRASDRAINVLYRTLSSTRCAQTYRMKEQRFMFPNSTIRPLAVRLKPSVLVTLTLLEVALTSSFYFVVPLSLSSAS